MDHDRWLHVAGLTALLSAIAGFLTYIAASIAIILYLIQIWETRTVQEWVLRRHERRIMRLSAKLAALQLKTDTKAASIELKGAAHAAVQTLQTEGKAAVAEVKQATADAKQAVKDAAAVPPSV